MGKGSESRISSISIGESLEEFASRTQQATAEAYAEWHEHGNRVAAAWQKPCRVAPSDPHATRPHVAIAGGRNFGLYGHG